MEAYFFIEISTCSSLLRTSNLSSQHGAASSYEEETIMAPDGKTKHLVWTLVRDELLSPVDPTNVLTESKTIEYLEVQCIAGLRKMHDRRIAIHDKLTSMDGANCIDNSQQAHRDTIGCHATNDALAESVFGTYDMILRRCPGKSQYGGGICSCTVCAISSIRVRRSR